MREHQGIIDSFRAGDGAKVLLSSEVGSEGLDFEFCHVLVNYDLPWNPMKVEQRIGRLDRYRPENSRIAIYSLVAADTIEDRIYARLFERIDIFEQAVGDLEAILGEVMRGLTGEVYRRMLTPEEEMRLADQAADNVLQHKKRKWRSSSGTVWSSWGRTRSSNRTSTRGRENRTLRRPE